jgi:integrase
MTLTDLYACLERDYRLNGRASLEVLPYHKGPVIAFFAGRQAEDLTGADIAAYKEWRLKSVAPGTVNNDLRYLSSAYSKALDEELIGRRPRIKCLRVDNARQGFLRPRGFDRLAKCLETLSPVVGQLARALYSLGWRSGELKRLAWSEVDVTGWVLRLPAARHKNRQPKSVALAGEALRVFQARWAARQGPWVFHRYGGEPVRHIGDVWRHACRATGHQGLRPHDLRRSFARNALHAGLKIPTIMLIGGWRTMSVFLRYAIQDDRDMRLALAQLSAWTEKGGDEAEGPILKLPAERA